MEITRSQCEKVKISKINGLDPITVFLEDLGPQQGQITIKCYDEIWSSYWGGMGDRNIAKFFCSCDHHYLANKLSRIEANEPDLEALRVKARKAIGKRRSKYEITKEEAKNLLEELKDHEIIPNSQSSYSFFSEVFNGSDWVFEIPEKPNYEYKYLCKVIDTVKEALSQ